MSASGMIGMTDEKYQGFQTSVSFFIGLQAVEVTVFMSGLSGKNPAAMSHLC